MAITRRQFIKRGALATAGVAASPYMRMVPGTNVAWAAGPGNKIVVVVQMNGGNDGLGTIYPLSGTQRSIYESIRPTLQEPDSDVAVASKYSGAFPDSTAVLSVGLDDDLEEYALHPTMTRLHAISQAGKLAISPGVHYPHSNHSHFRSEVIWYTGDPIGNGGQGWFGKTLDKLAFGPTQVPVVIMDGSLNPVYTPTTASLFAITRLNQLQFPANGETNAKRDAVLAMHGDSAALSSVTYPELSKIGQTGQATITKMEEYYKSGNGFPDSGNAGPVEALLLNGSGSYSANNDLVYTSPLNGVSSRLARDLRHVAAIIRADVGACYFHVDIGGFDSHSGQAKSLFHAGLLHTLSEAVGAFYEELDQSVTLPGSGGYGSHPYKTGNLINDAVIVTFSEFGRTMAQNASGANEAGTDHAASAAQMVLGGAVQGGIFGTYPKLDNPPAGHDNDLRYEHDVRDFFGTIINRWLGVPAGEIAGNGSSFVFPLTPTLDDDGRNYTGYTPIDFLL